MFDSHCHLQFKAYDEDQEEVIGRFIDAGITTLTVGTQKDTSKGAVELAKKYPGKIYASVGLHPVHLHPRYVDQQEGSFTSREEDFDYEFYKKLAQEKEVVAIGECGLDFYHMPDDVPADEVIAKQTAVFLQHIKLAQEVDLPLVIHCRDAYSELADLLKTLDNIPAGTVHCFTGNEKEAERLVDLGLNIGFTGIITFPARKSNPEAQERLLEAVRRVPFDKILIETDAPYLAPLKYRGKKNEPVMVEDVAAKIAELKNAALGEVIEITTQNATKLFNT